MKPFPYGWFALELSSQLQAGEVKALEYFGCDLVLFRDVKGVAHVLDAFCPHLGTHLGYGGRVVGETIQCPFHGWRFDGTGTCRQIPYSEKIPEGAARALRAWPTQEYGGMILTFWHQDGSPPEWKVPRIIPFGQEGWTETLWREWRVRSHPQDVLENSVDIHHFLHLHKMPPAQHVEAAEKGPILEVANEFHGGPGQSGGAALTASVRVTVVGMGLSLARSYREAVEGFVLSAATPVDGETVHVRIGVGVKEMGKAEDTENARRTLSEATFGNVEQDKEIWGHKICYENPRLTTSEEGIRVYRKWARQFYGSQA